MPTGRGYCRIAGCAARPTIKLSAVPMDEMRNSGETDRELLLRSEA